MLGMTEIDRFRAPQVDSETSKKLEKLLQTAESFGFEIWEFGFEILRVWHEMLGVWHEMLRVWHAM